MSKYPTVVNHGCMPGGGQTQKQNSEQDTVQIQEQTCQQYGPKPKRAMIPRYVSTLPVCKAFTRSYNARGWPANCRAARAKFCASSTARAHRSTSQLIPMAAFSIALNAFSLATNSASTFPAARISWTGSTKIGGCTRHTTSQMRR